VQCPRCHSIYPDTTLHCDCGYDFEPQTTHDSTPKPALPSQIVVRQAPPKGIVALALTGAIPLTLAGLAAALFIFAFSDDPNVSLIGWFLYAGGALAVFEGFAWLPLFAAWSLSNRRKTGWAYVMASMPAVTLVVFVLWFHNWVHR
jgi:hypothetical protein